MLNYQQVCHSSRKLEQQSALRTKEHLASTRCVSAERPEESASALHTNTHIQHTKQWALTQKCVLLYTILHLFTVKNKGFTGN